MSTAEQLGAPDPSRVDPVVLHWRLVILEIVRQRTRPRQNPTDICASLLTDLAAYLEMVKNEQQAAEAKQRNPRSHIKRPPRNLHDGRMATLKRKWGIEAHQAKQFATDMSRSFHEANTKFNLTMYLFSQI